MIARRGSVLAARAQRIDVRIPGARLGERVTVWTRSAVIAARVTALTPSSAILAPLQDARDVARGDRAVIEAGNDACVLGAPLLGRALDGLGRALDGGDAPHGARVARAAYSNAPSPAERQAPSRPLWTGVRAIDGLLTFACGMRVGVFGPPGSGKSRLLDAIARHIDADAVVIALIGERGVEAQRHLASIDARRTIVCATSDRSPGERVEAAELALAHASRLRACGLDVAVIFDSIARYVHAVREVALAAGEPPGRGGYPPSTFGRLAALCEGAGATTAGSLTLIATVLSDVADPSDPLAEAARSFLDGHVILSRRRAERGAFPAIDVPASLSRPMPGIAGTAHWEAACRVREALARLEETRDARELGIARAEPLEAALEAFLRQGPEPVSSSEVLASLHELADRL